MWLLRAEFDSWHLAGKFRLHVEPTKHGSRVVLKDGAREHFAQREKEVRKYFAR